SRRHAAPSNASLEPQQLGHAVVAAGRVAAVDGKRLTGDEGCVARYEEQRDGRNLVRASEPTELVLLTDLLAYLFQPRHAEDAFEHRRLDEARAYRIRADTCTPVVDREVLGEDHDRALRRVVRAAARGAFQTFHA